MAEITNIQKSIVDEIITEMISSISTHKEFDITFMEKLKQLAKSNELHKASPIIQTIKMK